MLAKTANEASAGTKLTFADVHDYAESVHKAFTKLGFVSGNAQLKQVDVPSRIHIIHRSEVNKSHIDIHIFCADEPCRTNGDFIVGAVYEVQASLTGIVTRQGTGYKRGLDRGGGGPVDISGPVHNVKENSFGWDETELARFKEEYKQWILEHASRDISRKVQPGSKIPPFQPLDLSSLSKA